MVGVGGLCVGVALGYTVTTGIVGVGVAVKAGGIVRVGEGVGADVELGLAWAGGSLVRAMGGVGKSVAVALGRGVAGVNP